MISRFTYEHCILLIGSDLTASTLRPYNTFYCLKRVAGYTLIRVSREPDNRWRGRFRHQIKKEKEKKRKKQKKKNDQKKKEKEKAHGSFQGLGKKGLNRRYRPAARNVATLPLTETFILAI